MMATTSRTRGGSTLNKIPEHAVTADTSLNLPAEALAPYSTHWNAINRAVGKKIRSDAMNVLGADAILVREYIITKTKEFDQLSAKLFDLMEDLGFFKFLTHDLQAAAYDHFVWMVVCEALFKEAVPFPGDTKVWMAFREWLYCEMNVKVEVEFKAVLEMDEVMDVEDDGQWPKSGEGLEDRYADGEDEDTDGGVRLVWA
ncbi:uncharacterized protein PAC_04529 [Phialocephala subalpina]|uniref:Uncharacterized protein n=1 Tax=Phialocephala subalpina TaxID=576137 RepID=A0A1L7WPD8_9HELO|nr:uncharacterized protein PAC_04529 [Phialocephala subalpina]